MSMEPGEAPGGGGIPRPFGTAAYQRSSFPQEGLEILWHWLWQARGEGRGEAEVERLGQLLW